MVREPQWFENQRLCPPLGGAAALGALNCRLRFPKVLVRHNANTCNNNN